MIQPGTILNVADNSGAKKINCITVLGGYKQATAGVGDVIVASIREMKRQGKGQVSKVQKGQVVHCVIIRTKKEKQFLPGSHTRLQKTLLCLSTLLVRNLLVHVF